MGYNIRRSMLFWDVTQRRMAILHRCCGTMYRSHTQGSRNYLHLMKVRGPSLCSQQPTSCIYLVCDDQGIYSCLRQNQCSACKFVNRQGIRRHVMRMLSTCYKQQQYSQSLQDLFNDSHNLPGLLQTSNNQRPSYI